MFIVKGNNKIKVFACFAIFVLLFLGSFPIGPVTFRNVVALLLGVSILINVNFYKPNKIYNTFFAFVVAVLFCTLISGDLFSEQFFRFFIGYHITSIIVIVALYSLLSRMESIEPIIAFISAVFLLNAILTIAQSLNYHGAWLIVTFFYPSGGVADSREMLSSAESVLNIRVCGGLCGGAVGNGYFTSVFYPLATLSIWKKNNMMGKVYSYCMIAITLYSSFCIQQRMCFYIVVLYSLYMIVFSTSSSRRILILLIFAVALLIVGDINFDSSNLGHLSEKMSEDSARRALVTQFCQFLKYGNVFIGGQSDYLMYGGGQHNTFLDCMTRYGLIGTSFLIVLYFRVLVRCIKSFIEFRRLGVYGLMSISICPIIYLLYSLSHSTGLQSGDPLFWIVFVVLCVGERKYYKEVH